MRKRACSKRRQLCSPSAHPRARDQHDLTAIVSQ
eukprot:COSAG01_NODE_58383_length_306_cov_1.000000_1_plen_33_part_10